MAYLSVTEIIVVLTCRLAEAEKFLDFAYVYLVYSGEVGEVTLLLLRLLREDVTLEGMFALDLTRASERETLLSTGVCLQLRHFLSCLYKLFH